MQDCVSGCNQVKGVKAVIDWKDKTVTWLLFLLALLLLGTFFYVTEIEGLWSTPVSALPLTYWVLLISTLLITIITILGVELGTIPALRTESDKSRSSLDSIVPLFIPGGILCLAGRWYDSHYWNGLGLFITNIGASNLILGTILLFVRAVR